MGSVPNAPPEGAAKVAPLHVSFSQINAWLRCGKAYQLQRILGLAEQPAWWSIGGTGVHSATEKYDRLLEQAKGEQQ